MNVTLTILVISLVRYFSNVLTALCSDSLSQTSLKERSVPGVMINICVLQKKRGCGFLVSVQMRLNPYLTNGIAHHYHLDECTFILGTSGLFLIFYSIIRWNFSMQTEKPQMGRCTQRRPIWSYSVCLCHTHRTPGLN